MKNLLTLIVSTLLLAFSFAPKAMASIEVSLSYSLQWQSTFDENLGWLSEGRYGDEVDVSLYFHIPDWTLDFNTPPQGSVGAGFYVWDYWSEVGVDASVGHSSVPFISSAEVNLLFDSNWSLVEWSAFADLYNSDSWEASFGSSSPDTQPGGARLTLRHHDESNPDWYSDPFQRTDIYTGYLSSITIISDGITLSETFAPPQLHVVPEASGLPLLMLGLLPLFARRLMSSRRHQR